MSHREVLHADETTLLVLHEPGKEPQRNSYILNTSSKKIHVPDCGAVKKMADKNRAAYTGTFDELVGMGYSPCGICNPN